MGTNCTADIVEEEEDATNSTYTEPSVGEIIADDIDASLPGTSGIEKGAQQSRQKLSESALFDGTFFDVINIGERNMEAKCNLCEKNNIIKGLKAVNSNFIKHIKRKHSFEEYTNYKKLKQLDKVNPNFQSRIKKVPSKKSKLQQDKFDEKIVDCVISNVLPLDLVELPSFVDLFEGTGFSIINRKDLLTEIDKKFKNFIVSIKQELDKIQYVCTTADVLSAEHRSYLGVTCHWLDANLKRHSVILACKRLRVIHSYDRIAEMLEDIHLMFNLDPNKIVAMITDNGSNIVKALKECSIQLATEYEEGSDSEDDSLNFVDMSDISFEQSILPKHYRCASHPLNLLATSDLNKAINNNEAIKISHEKVISKCNILWNKAACPKSEEIIQNILGHSLSYPTIIQWNSFYNSITHILKEKDKLKELFQSLEISDSLKEIEIQYLEEYCVLLKPIAEALNFLQEENNTFYGYLLATIVSLKVKFEQLRDNVKLRNLKTVVEEITSALQKRYSDIFNLTNKSYDVIIAAVTIPCIKLRWLNVLRESILLSQVDSKYIINIVVDATYNLFSTDEVKEDEKTDVPADSFFDFKENIVIKKEEHEEPYLKKNEIELELRRYLEDKRQNLEMLVDYPIVRNIFVRYNTILLSSAPVERQFSFEKFFNNPRRNAKSDELFEKLVLINANSQFLF